MTDRVTPYPCFPARLRRDALSVTGLLRGFSLLSVPMPRNLKPSGASPHPPTGPRSSWPHTEARALGRVRLLHESRVLDHPVGSRPTGLPAGEQCEAIDEEPIRSPVDQLLGKALQASSIAMLLELPGRHARGRDRWVGPSSGRSTRNLLKRRGIFAARARAGPYCPRFE